MPAQSSPRPRREQQKRERDRRDRRPDAGRRERAHRPARRPRRRVHAVRDAPADHPRPQDLGPPGPDHRAARGHGVHADPGQGVHGDGEPAVPRRPDGAHERRTRRAASPTRPASRRRTTRSSRCPRSPAAPRSSRATTSPRATCAPPSTSAPARRATSSQINATTPDPKLSAAIANAYGAAYIAFRKEADQKQLQDAIDLASRQIEALQPSERDSAQGQRLQENLDQLRQTQALQTGKADLVQRAAAAGRARPRRTSSAT